ncbi:DUF2202 domain-containing protein [Methanosarcina acetivorans]|jgi:hypothetical protein|uniref:DUF2202 domain-containing protein n=1 Tax=Methanosarcina acetivorans (strain ATCC 35395 / DSM 2834 / JCM 12185 / C2A) TaxID=188937 RepID=Q8TTL0_METAC|nr:DUF2202 domain-containing protein [Methanosarcina acetivorans]AAM03868.1 conserved hypothetical protein [Methanosarcina acetivorans C2A]
MINYLGVIQIRENISSLTFFVLLLITAVVGISGCQENGTNSESTDTSGVTLQDSVLNDTEINSLIYMREEEKLARDVYLYLYDKWNIPIFRNIAASEQEHTDAVKSLLTQYGVQDPASTTSEGEFTNPELQELYNQLIQQGSVSREDALKVGVIIEEKDIRDLEADLANTTNSDIKIVYGNLLRGSNNHLSAFNTQLGK